MLFNPIDSRSLYTMVDYNSRLMQPMADYAYGLADQINAFSEQINIPGGIPYLPALTSMFTFLQPPLRSIAASLYSFHTLVDMYEKPSFDIVETEIAGKFVEIIEVIALRRIFCDLLHFKKLSDVQQPVMIVVAPMSGHYATLLRDTVKDLLPYYDVYITDWKNARDIPLSKGGFDFTRFVNYIIEFIQFLGPDVHVMAVCQPTVPVITAVSLMASGNDPKAAKSVTLIGGPVDTTQMPTTVNDLADTRRINWFQQHVISIVPHNYPGAMRLVYPGFMQLLGFFTMNFERHQRSIGQAIKHFADGKVEESQKVTRFYREYLSVMDITAEFYTQTITIVFQEKLLPKGKLMWRGQHVCPQDITNTAVLAIEGERDDITGLGQTKAVLDLCANLPASKKAYHLQEDVGHYGLFNGRKFREQIIPVIRAFTEAHG
jgi:poly(3-hydroxybutyrate) depolymerase